MNLNIKKRSPSSPSLSLKEAINKALVIYNKEKLYLMHHDIAAQHLGYSNATNGAAGAVLATLKVFGLLYVPEKGWLAVSGDIQEYKLNPDELMKQQLRHKWLNTPKVYLAIFDKYGADLPSDENLCHFLVSVLNFKDEESASQCIKRFKESLDDVVGSKSVQNEPSDEERTTKQAGSGVYDRFPIRLPNKRKAWIEVPELFFESDKQLIKAQLDLILTEEQS